MNHISRLSITVGLADKQSSHFSVQPPLHHRTRLSSTTIGNRAFPVAAARICNSLPQHVTSASSAPSSLVFRSRLKTNPFTISYIISYHIISYHIICFIMTSDKTQMKLQTLQNTATNVIYTMYGPTYEMIQYMSLYNILVIKLQSSKCP